MKPTLAALSVLALLTALPLLAQDPPDDALSPPPTAPAITDPAQIARHYHQVAARAEFRDVPGSSVNPQLEDLLSEWFQRIGKQMGDFKYASRMPAFESLLMSLLVAFSLGILVYIILRLTRGHTWNWTEPRLPMAEEKTLPPPEFYEEEIAQAVRAGDWHAAWLAAWRQFLSRLEHRSLVEADRTRTNREYLGQLSGQSLPAPALALVVGMVDSYDRFIYGHAAIGPAEYSAFRRHIEEAGLLLHLDDKRTVTGGATP